MIRDHKNTGRMITRVGILVFFSLIVLFIVNRIEACSLPLHTIQLPPGFTITVYADNVPNARGMTLGQNGTLFVGSKHIGNVYAVIDTDSDQRADQVFTIARGLNKPVGVAYQ